MTTNYTKTFKIELIKKVFSKAPGVSIRSIVRALGVPQTTFHGWLKAMSDKNLNDSPLVGSRFKKVLVIGWQKSVFQGQCTIKSVNSKF